MRIQLFPDTMGQSLLTHCMEEMRILAALLPDLYQRESGKERANG